MRALSKDCLENISQLYYSMLLVFVLIHILEPYSHALLPHTQWVVPHTLLQDVHSKN